MAIKKAPTVVLIVLIINRPVNPTPAAQAKGGAGVGFTGFPSITPWAIVAYNAALVRELIRSRSVPYWLNE